VIVMTMHPLACSTRLARALSLAGCLALLAPGAAVLAKKSAPAPPAKGVKPTPAATPAPPSVAAPEKPWELLAPLRVARLDNGMTFLIYPNRRAPIFSAVIRFDVGGKDEPSGLTGIAHMFEHMAFKGTRLVGTTDWPAESKELDKIEAAATAYDAERERLIAAGADPDAMAAQLAPLKKSLAQAQAAAARHEVKGEFDQIYSREGGVDLNAHTSPDATAYEVSLPANRLELWARMESDRLTSPVMREFYSERDVVMEERRMRNDNDPQGRLWEMTMAMAFLTSPYRRPTIGYASDIRNLKAEEAYAFFRSHYAPDRALGVIVGDVDADKTEALLREQFGKIPARPAALRAAAPITPEGPQQGERRAILRLDAQPMLLLAWHKPALPDPADIRAEALGEVVAGGRSTRWFERLVKREKLATEVDAFTAPGDALPNLFMIYATPQGKATPAQLEKALREEVARLRAEPVAAEELAAAKKRLRADAIRALETNMGLAGRLAEAAQISGDPYYLERRLRRIERLSPADLQAFAKRYLIDDNLTVTELLPPDGPPAPATTAATTKTRVVDAATTASKTTDVATTTTKPAAPPTAAR
jgi:predicted Zn-dependent peptidase